jgi:futalosine hydrolase
MIDRYQPQLVINIGCAGAYIGSGLSIGNLVVASEEVLADDGVTVAAGWKDLRYMNIPTVEQGGMNCYNLLPLSRHAAEKAMQLADCYGVFLKRGRFATVSTCSGTRQHGAELSHRWNVIVENMEGAAVAQVCLRCGIDCLEIRGISNMVEERDLKKWDIPRAVESAQRFVLKYLEDMDRPEIYPIPKGMQ